MISAGGEQGGQVRMGPRSEERTRSERASAHGEPGAILASPTRSNVASGNCASASITKA
jgi:hypothetical protein